MSDADDVTCARFALGEFALHPRSLPDRPPELLAGRYEVGRLIGSGGTARVYRAYDVRLAREVAVKIYDREVVALDQRRRLREMSIQGSITHPGVVALLDSGATHGRTYLVMQLVEGENLAERLLGGPMPAAEVTALADGLTDALAHVHARRVVHRDLKPANVFLSAHGPLIGDFGIAHALDTTHITGTGVVPGTAAYLAPEQVGGEPAGPPADVYALGLILLECLTGRREYPGTMIEAAMARLTRPPRIPEGLPPSLAHTIRRMTHREPADRPTAAEVRQLLHTPAPPWTTGRSAAAGVLRRWHRAAPADRRGRGRSGAVGGRGAADDGGRIGESGSLGAAAGNLGPGTGGHGSLEPTSGDLAAINPSPLDAAPSHPSRPGTGVSGHSPLEPTASNLAANNPSPLDAAPSHPSRPGTGVSGHSPLEPTATDLAADNPGRRDPRSDRSGRLGPFDPTVADTGIPHRTAPTGPRKILAAVGLSPASLPAQRRRFTAAAGLTAAAVAAVSAMLLSAQEPGTAPTTPAQPPAPSSVAPAQAPLAGSGTPDPRPGATETAALEPAAVTHESPSKTTKPGKPPNPGSHGTGKGKGKGLGHD
ncbi:serine/threonine-protein kinase [Amycolatopsis camponoti]|nr:serine/threonine-protein kinase [Amycolatopsis camponoti]